MEYRISKFSQKGDLLFDFIEFMDDSYLLSIVLTKRTLILNISITLMFNVNLMYDIGAKTMRVARLTILW